MAKPRSACAGGAATRHSAIIHARPSSSPPHTRRESPRAACARRWRLVVRNLLRPQPSSASARGCFRLRRIAAAMRYWRGSVHAARRVRKPWIAKGWIGWRRCSRKRLALARRNVRADGMRRARAFARFCRVWRERSAAGDDDRASWVRRLHLIRTVRSHLMRRWLEASLARWRHEHGHKGYRLLAMRAFDIGRQMRTAGFAYRRWYLNATAGIMAREAGARVMLTAHSHRLRRALAVWRRKAPLLMRAATTAAAASSQQQPPPPQVAAEEEDAGLVRGGQYAPSRGRGWQAACKACTVP